MTVTNNLLTSPVFFTLDFSLTKKENMDFTRDWAIETIQDHNDDAISAPCCCSFCAIAAEVIYRTDPQVVDIGSTGYISGVKISGDAIAREGQ